MRSVLLIMLIIVAWELICHVFAIPAWLLPAPRAVLASLVKDAPALLNSLWFTAKLSFAAFFMAVVSGFVVGLLAHVSKGVREGIYPLTILLQTTPVVSVAPLFIIWFRNNAFLALLACSWLVCVYPMISSTLAGLNKADANLRKLFRLYRSSLFMQLFHLELPAALPYIMNGVRITGGLSLVGAIGAEFVAGTGGQELGLAYRLLMAAYNQETSRLFAALCVVSVFGLLIHMVLSLLEKAVLKKLRLDFAA